MVEAYSYTPVQVTFRINAIATPLTANTIQQAIPTYPVWIVWPITLLGLINAGCAVALFMWKKWGFLGLIITSLITFGLNLYAGIGIPQALVGLVGIAILYGVLQIGGMRKGWPQLA
jgi:hypothetical protein